MYRKEEEQCLTEDGRSILASIIMSTQGTIEGRHPSVAMPTAWISLLPGTFFTIIRYMTAKFPCVWPTSNLFNFRGICYSDKAERSEHLQWHYSSIKVLWDQTLQSTQNSKNNTKEILLDRYSQTAKLGNCSVQSDLVNPCFLKSVYLTTRTHLLRTSSGISYLKWFSNSYIFRTQADFKAY